ncbi:MAG TPA: MBL fold metallo-hydrolase, partial [Candidatus Edwardsbacteria bacterium]|nr:MBL fold metallo-hydrolase [Candidatus Edwardsbacteria bacterium]
DSISVYDREDNVLFVGDNVEKPLPYLYSRDLEQYQRTLDSYLKFKAKRIIAGHCATVTRKTIRQDLEYLRAFSSNKTRKYETGRFKQAHGQNVKVMQMLRNK